MKRTVLTVVLAVLLTLAAVAVVAAQTGSLAGLLSPLVVTVQQAVPVELTVATALDDGTVVTSTVPLTVGVDLAITIAGEQVVALTAGASEAEVEVEALPTGEELTDNNGLGYTIEGTDDLVVQQISSGADYAGDFELLGEVENTGRRDAAFPEVNVTLFDAGGKILESTSGYLQLTPLEAGRTSSFSIMTSIPFDEVARYRVQLED